jgi:nucleoside 2-deoxyribosyltransferase
MKSIYIIGSLRNPDIMALGNQLREIGLDVFDDWHAAAPDCDDHWKAYCQIRGQSYGQALKDHMAQHIFEFDKFHLDRTDGAVLLTPAGKSGHLELGYTVGRGKPGFILFDKEPEDRWDIMYQFATEIFFDRKKFLDTIAEKYAN